MLSAVFCLQQMKHISGRGEIAGHQQITPQSITQVDEMTKEYIFSGEQFTGKNICLAFYSIHLGIEVYEDGELIYNLKPVPGIFGTTPGSVWNFWRSIRIVGRSL